MIKVKYCLNLELLSVDLPLFYVSVNSHFCISGLAFLLFIFHYICTVAVENIRNMCTVSTNQIADILDFIGATNLHFMHYSCVVIILFNTVYLDKPAFCTYRSSHSEVFLGKGVLKICSKFTGEYPCRSAISIKLLCNFVETAVRHECSPVNLLHISRTLFPRNTSGWLLLIFCNISNFHKEAFKKYVRSGFTSFDPSPPFLLVCFCSFLSTPPPLFQGKFVLARTLPLPLNNNNAHWYLWLNSPCLLKSHSGIKWTPLVYDKSVHFMEMSAL